MPSPPRARVLQCPVDVVDMAAAVDRLAELIEAPAGPDGAVVVRLEVTNIGALRSWVLELGEHAEVLAPDDVRAAMVSWLEAIAIGSSSPVGD